MSRFLSMAKAVVSVVLLLFSLVLIHVLIFERKTICSEHVHPFVAVIGFWLGLLVMSMVEGGQASLLGLPPIDQTLYEQTHPISHSICKLAHKGTNLARYLMGRQLLIIPILFTINCSGAPTAQTDVLNLPLGIADKFIVTGLAMVIVTGTIGQMAPQILASHCMLDYINTRLITFTLYVALGIEASGLMHTSYLFLFAVAAVTGKESNHWPRKPVEKILFWARVALSTSILAVGLVITFNALFLGKTTMWEGLKNAASIVVLVASWCIVGFLEGMQVAFYAVSKMTEGERKVSPWASRTCDLLFDPNGRNLPAFMVGRIACVVAVFYVAARATTFDISEGESNLLGVPDAVQTFFNTSLVGALATTVMASTAWKLVACAYPLSFISVPPTYFLLRVCLFVESLGLFQGAWVFAKIIKRMAGVRYDEVIYVDLVKARAAAKSADEERAMRDLDLTEGPSGGDTGRTLSDASLSNEVRPWRQVLNDTIALEGR